MTWFDGDPLHRVRRLGWRSRDAVARVQTFPEGSAGGASARDFEALTLPHAGALYRSAYSLTRSVVDAEDLVQETYLRAYRGFAQFRGGDVRTWLFTILRHAFLDECRRRGRGSTVELQIGETGAIAGISLVATSSPSAETEVLRHFPSEAVERAFAELPPDWRLIVLLADVEDLSYREIAEILGVPIGTVMSRLHRARKRLQERLLDPTRACWSQHERSA